MTNPCLTLCELTLRALTVRFVKAQTLNSRITGIGEGVEKVRMIDRQIRLLAPRAALSL